MQSAQIRAARALLGVSQGELAKRAKIATITLHRLEQPDGVLKAQYATVLQVQNVLERAGIVFVDDDRGVGVLLKRGRSGS